jgi:hypothetical protein
MHALSRRVPYHSLEPAQSLLVAPATGSIGCGAAEIRHSADGWLMKLKHWLAEAHLQLPSSALIEYAFPVLSQAVTHAAAVWTPSQSAAGEQSTAVAMLTQVVGLCGAGGDGGGDGGGKVGGAGAAGGDGVKGGGGGVEGGLLDCSQQGTMKCVNVIGAMK